jgi:hypothetical protein
MRDYVWRQCTFYTVSSSRMDHPELQWEKSLKREGENFFFSFLCPGRSNILPMAAEVASTQLYRRSISSSAHGQSRLPDVRVAQRKGGSMDLGCASAEPIYARYREIASEMLAPGPPSGLCSLVVSNHNMCLDAPARQLIEQNPHAAQWSAPS